MNPTKLSFESENLSIHYICFNIQGFIELEDIKKIAFYLFESFGFNSTFISYDRTQGWEEKKIFYMSKNQHKVSFHQFDYNPQIKSFWVGTKIHFSGGNGCQVYNQVKKNQFNWGIFDGLSVTLSRMDVCYFRGTKLNDQNELLEDFMEKCCQRIKTKDKRRKAEWNLESAGLVLRIGHRGSSKFYRVYENDKGLRFELELKKELAKSFQKLLMNNHLQQLENDLSKLFYSHSFSSLNLNSCYTDWLLNRYRIGSVQEKFNVFITTYFNIESLLLSDNKKLIFHFLRILSFIRNQENIKQTFKIDDDSQTFHVVKFRLVDFLRFIKVNERNHRQRTNILEIFKEFEYLHDFKLQIFRTTLDDSLNLNNDFNGNEFSSIVMIPFFKIKKEKNVWYVTLLMANQFYECNFPFQFKDYFLIWKSTYQFEVKVQILQPLAQPRPKKEFDVEKFLAPFDGLSNSKKTKIKKLFIEGIKEEIENRFLELKFQMIQKDGSVKNTNQLVPISLTKSKYIYFYENLDSKSFLKNF